MNRALFLDRDGVINEDYGYVHKIENFHFREGIFDVCRAAQKERMKIIVVTNQAGIGRGMYNHGDFNVVTNYMLSQFASYGLNIARVYYCPFHPEFGLGQYKRCSLDRKPSPGLLIKACNDFNINPRASVMIGDSATDKEAAISAGITRFVDATKKAWLADAFYSIRSC